MIFCSAMHFMIGNSLCSLPQKNQQISITYLNKLCNRREMGSTYIIYIQRYICAHTSVLIASPASSKIEWKSAYKANAKPQEFSIFARLYHRYIPYIYIQTIYTRYYHISLYTHVWRRSALYSLYLSAHIEIIFMGLLWRNFAKCLDNQLWEHAIPRRSVWTICRASWLQCAKVLLMTRSSSARLIDGVGGQIERCARVLLCFFYAVVLITIRNNGTRQSYIV